MWVGCSPPIMLYPAARRTRFGNQNLLKICGRPSKFADQKFCGGDGHDGKKCESTEANHNGPPPGGRLPMKDEEEVRALWREYVARAYEADVFSDGDATRKPKYRRKRPAAGAAAAASGSGGGSGASGAGSAGASGAGSGGAGGEDPPPPLPGRRVRVWWPAEKRWFRGLVLSSSAAEGHTIKYEDGEVPPRDAPRRPAAPRRPRLTPTRPRPPPSAFRAGATPPDGEGGLAVGLRRDVGPRGAGGGQVVRRGEQQRRRGRRRRRRWLQAPRPAGGAVPVGALRQRRAVACGAAAAKAAEAAKGVDAVPIVRGVRRQAPAAHVRQGETAVRRRAERRGRAARRRVAATGRHTQLSDQ